MSNVDFSKITEGIYHVIETEEKMVLRQIWWYFFYCE